MSAVIDVVVLGEIYLLVDCLYDVVYGTSQVAAVDIGGNDNASAYILAIDGIGTSGGYDVGYVAQRYLALIAVNHEVGYVFHRIAQIVVDNYRQVVGKAVFINLADNLSGQCHIDKFHKFADRNAVTRKHFTAGTQIELWAAYLLLYVYVYDAGNLRYTFLDVGTE